MQRHCFWSVLLPFVVLRQHQLGQNHQLQFCRYNQVLIFGLSSLASNFGCAFGSFHFNLPVKLQSSALHIRSSWLPEQVNIYRFCNIRIKEDQISGQLGPARQVVKTALIACSGRTCGSTSCSHLPQGSLKDMRGRHMFSPNACSVFQQPAPCNDRAVR